MFSDTHLPSTLLGQSISELRCPPGIARFAHPAWASSLLHVFVGEGALRRLEVELARQKKLAVRYRDIWSPTLALPLDSDPADFRWPVKGRNVATVGVAPRPVLLRLAQALLRDGAEVVAGLLESGELFIASDREAYDAT